MIAGVNRLRFLLDHLEEGVMAVLLAFMTCLTFIQVVLRYVFNSGWVWSLEATTYAFAWLVLIGMSYGVRTRTHIAVDLVVKKLPSAMRHYAALLAVGLCMLYSGLMIYGAYAFVDGLHTLGHSARDIPLPKWLLTAVMPLVFILLAFRFLEVGVRVVKSKDEDLGFGERDAPSAVRGKAAGGGADP